MLSLLQLSQNAAESWHWASTLEGKHPNVFAKQSAGKPPRPCADAKPVPGKQQNQKGLCGSFSPTCVSTPQVWQH